MPSAYPFAFAAARYLEPPTRSHDARCAREDGTWYRCPDRYCEKVFDFIGRTRNVCPVCGTFSKRVTECTCDRIWSE